jgi:hypothetical protein
MVIMGESRGVRPFSHGPHGNQTSSSIYFKLPPFPIPTKQLLSVEPGITQNSVQSNCLSVHQHLLMKESQGSCTYICFSVEHLLTSAENYIKEL